MIICYYNLIECDFFLNIWFLFLLYLSVRLRDRGSEVASLLLEHGGYVYVCGDGMHMAKDVNTALLDILMEHGKLSSDDASKVLLDMRQRRRYVQDIWS